MCFRSIVSSNYDARVDFRYENSSMRHLSLKRGQMCTCDGLELRSLENAVKQQMIDILLIIVVVVVVIIIIIIIMIIIIIILIIIIIIMSIFPEHLSM